MIEREETRFVAAADWTDDCRVGSPRVKDLTGRRFGRLTVVRRNGASNAGKALWLCRCDCGGSKTTLSASLLRGRTTSCGCRQVAEARQRLTKHGQAARRSRTVLYKTWAGMKARCMNPNTTGYENYGGRGIRVCPEWIDSFEAFAAHVGDRPGPDYSIDRIDNDGHYEPGNVRWATRAEQNRNQRKRKDARA